MRAYVYGSKFDIQEDIKSRYLKMFVELCDFGFRIIINFWIILSIFVCLSILALLTEEYLSYSYISQLGNSHLSSLFPPLPSQNDLELALSRSL